MENKMHYQDIADVKKPVSRIVYGTAIGPMMKGEDAFELLDAVYAAGVNTFDTAADYGNAEASLGNWIEARNLRDKVVVMTKGANTSPWRHRLTTHDILTDFKTSLAKLKTDYVDIYFLHRDDPSVAVGPIVEQLNELHAAGKIGAFGGSNWTIPRIEQANEYAYQRNLKPFTVSSPSYGLAEMIADPCGDSVTLSGEKNKEVRAWYQKNNMPIFAYSSLGRGFFSGRIQSDQQDQAAEIIGLGGLEYGFPVNFERLKRAETLSAAKDVTVAQIALAWLCKQPLNLHAVTSTGNIGRMQASIDAMHMELTDQELQWLNLEIDSI